MINVRRIRALLEARGLFRAFFGVAIVFGMSAGATVALGEETQQERLERQQRELEAKSVEAQNTANKGVRDSAGLAMASQLIGTSVNTGVGVMLVKQCGSNSSACAMGVMSLEDARQSLETALESANSRNKATGSGVGSFYIPDAPDSTGELPEDGAGDPEVPGLDPNLVGNYQTQINEGLKTLKEMGYSMEGDKVKTPEGDFPASAFSSPQAMADSGFISSGDLEATQELFNKMAQESANAYRVSRMNLNTSGGGGFGGRKNSISSSSGSFKSLFKNMGLNRKPSSVAGMKKVVANGESIGVKMDNLFDMVHRRYQTKSRANEFVGVGSSRRKR